MGACFPLAGLPTNSIMRAELRSVVVDWYMKPRLGIPSRHVRLVPEADIGAISQSREFSHRATALMDVALREITDTMRTQAMLLDDPKQTIAFSDP